MADSARLTVRRRRLGRELRRIREELGWTQAKAARLMDRPASSLAKVERGEQGLRQDELLDILDAYRVADPQLRQFLITLRRDAGKRGWWQRYKDILEPRMLDLISLESDAKAIRMFEALHLPGLLQTEDYVRAMLRAGVSPPGPREEHELVAVRLTRQQVLAGPNAPEVSAILGEAALRYCVGNPDVMSAQLTRVLEVSEEGKIAVQVLPFSAGATPGLDGAFTVMDVGEYGELGIVVVETLARGWYLEDKEDLRHYGLAFDHLCASALSVRDSRVLIQRVLSEL